MFAFESLVYTWPDTSFKIYLIHISTNVYCFNKKKKIINDNLKKTLVHDVSHTDIFQYNFVLQQLYERGYLHKIPLVFVNINIKKIFFSTPYNLFLKHL